MSCRQRAVGCICYKLGHAGPELPRRDWINPVASRKHLSSWSVICHFMYDAAKGCSSQTSRSQVTRQGGRRTQKHRYRSPFECLRTVTFKTEQVKARFSSYQHNWAKPPNEMAPALWSDRQRCSAGELRRRWVTISSVVGDNAYLARLELLCSLEKGRDTI